MLVFPVKTNHDVSHLLHVNVVVNASHSQPFAEIHDDFTLTTYLGTTQHPSLESACSELGQQILDASKPQYVVEVQGKPWNVDYEINYAIAKGYLDYDPTEKVNSLREKLRVAGVDPMYHLHQSRARCPEDNLVPALLLANQYVVPFDAQDESEWSIDGNAYRNPDIIRDKETGTVLVRTYPFELDTFGPIWRSSREHIHAPINLDHLTLPIIYKTDMGLTDDRESANHYAYRVRHDQYINWTNRVKSPLDVLKGDPLGDAFRVTVLPNDDPYTLSVYAMVFADGLASGLTRKELMARIREDFPTQYDALLKDSITRILAGSYLVDNTPLSGKPVSEARNVKWIGVSNTSAIVNNEEGWSDFLTYVSAGRAASIPTPPVNVTYPILVNVHSALSVDGELIVYTTPLSSITTALSAVGV